ncbi:capsular exopolysaccharide family [Eubacterium uniforme]|uniref:non-specific protein-tyrosine kinase n=1 Tax=Eubacterium uniforme TaxID=39495 RepID=A0A1T4VHA1_9FIRM|nr:CpsD/CapB family tyrosine-protein kinase [Eubacterium uniforme]SKA64316.1 capsular exopolysaccharide family [Eubacterium uniforme]
MNKKIVFGKKYELPYALEESINRLRVNVGFLGNDIKKIMIISSEPNEGKSFVATNLWKQMSMAGEKSLLIDCDMRNSVLLRNYGIKEASNGKLRGTSHYLSDSSKIEDVIYSTEYENGDILPNVDNVINPSMLLENKKFDEMLKYAEENYRYVFVDAPPLELVSDGESIASKCDGVILCIRGGVTSKQIVRNSISRLERAGCPILGVVLNRVNSTKKRYGKYYGKKYYYGKEGK